MPLEPSLAKELADAWPDMMPGLLVVAARIARYHRAEDLLQEAYLRILEGTRVWDRHAEPHLFRFVCSVMGSIANGRAERAQREGPGGVEAWVARSPTPEEATSMKELHELFMRAVDFIRGKLGEGDLRRMVLELRYVEGVDKPAEQAMRLEVHIDRVYKANEWVERELSKLLGGMKRAVAPPPDVDAAAREVSAMTPEAIDAELRRAGYDPERVAAAGAAMAAGFAKIGRS
jgi:DNA-directed RNA polymerase specialized sigma24 family protein